MQKNRAFSLVYKEQKTLKYLVNKNMHISNVMVRLKDSDIMDIPAATLNEMLNCAESMALSLRAILYERDSQDDDSSSIECKYGLPSFPVRITANERELRVFMPYTFPRKGTSAVVLANYLKDEFWRYRKANPGCDLTQLITPPYVAMVKRKCNRKTAKRLQDNDNYEISRYINVIMSEIGGTDNNLCMTFGQCYSTLSIVDDADLFGIEIVVFSECDFVNYIDEFRYRLSDIKLNDISR